MASYATKLSMDSLHIATTTTSQKKTMEDVAKNGSKKENEDFLYECSVLLFHEKTVIVRSNKISDFWTDIEVAFNQSIFRDFVGIRKAGTNDLFPPHTTFIDTGRYTLVARTHDLDDQQLDEVIQASVDKLKELRPLVSPSVLRRLEEELLLLYTHFSLSHEGNSFGLDETRLMTNLIAEKDWKHEADVEETAKIASKSKQDLSEVINHIIISQSLHKTAKEPLDESAVLRLHKTLMQDLLHNEEHGLPGEYRKVHVEVGGVRRAHPGYLEDGMKIFFDDNLPREEDERIFDYLARVHNEFQELHPFVDGNGRTGRLIINILLLQHGYPLLVLPPTLSPMFNYACELGVVGSMRGNSNCNKLFSRLCAEAVFGSLQAYERALGEQLLPSIQDLLGEENVAVRGEPAVISPERP